MEPSRNMEDGRRCFMLVLITRRRIGAPEIMAQLQEAAPGVRVEIF
jgi:hypothetical protein